MQNLSPEQVRQQFDDDLESFKLNSASLVWPKPNSIPDVGVPEGFQLSCYFKDNSALVSENLGGDRTIHSKEKPFVIHSVGAIPCDSPNNVLFQLYGDIRYYQDGLAWCRYVRTADMPILLSAIHFDIASKPDK